MSAYLDYNATTPLDERVLVMMESLQRDIFGNASSLHTWGRKARRAIDLAREQVADLVNAHPSQVVFTSGGTESNNLALLGFAGAHQGVRRLAVSRVEHTSLLMPARYLAQQGWLLDCLPVDSDGCLATPVSLTSDVALASVMLANNETGVINDLSLLIESGRSHGTVFHTDAVQAVGKISVDFPALGVQMMSLASHKIYGPKGAGALIVDKSLTLMPQIHGSGQERGLRSGTEDVVAIAGFGLAAQFAREDLAARNEHLLRLRLRLEQGLAQLPSVVVFSAQAERLTNTVFFALPGVDGATLLQNLDRAGFGISSGAACDSALGEPSHVLLAMGVDPDLARGAVRVSLGRYNTQQEIDDFLAELTRQWGWFKQLSQRVLA